LENENKNSVLDYTSLIPLETLRKLEKGEITLKDIFPLHSSNEDK